MRLRLLLLPVLVPGLLAAPVLTLPAAAARPVPPVVVEVPLEAVPPSGSASASALRAAGPRTLVLTEPRATRPFEVVGVTWDAGGDAELSVQLRTRSEGAWSDWTAVDAEDANPDEPTARPGTEPLWVGEADGVQARVDLLSGSAPRGLRLSLVDPGESPADAATAPRSTAHASSAVPAVRSRAAWGADESIRRGRPSYSSTLRAITVHHTASRSDYRPEQVPGILRGFYAYHVKSNGWSDVGYNFLVDRFGTVWEGRYGGTDRNVIGAHAGGFNTGTVGISMIGTYESDRPTAAMLEGVAQVAGWKAARAGIDPTGSVTLTSGGSSRYKAGTAVRLPTVFGHRDVSSTSCPGTLGYAALPGLRTRAAALAAGAAPAAPVVEEVPQGLRLEAPERAAAGETVPVVVHGDPGRQVQVWFSRTDGGGTLRREGVLDERGTYRTEYTADAPYDLFAVVDGVASARSTVPLSSGTAVPLTASPLAVRGPVTAPAGEPVLVTVTGPPGTAFTVWFRNESEDAFVRRRSGVLDGSGSWTTSYANSAVHEYFAMSSTAMSADASTAVGPVPNGLHVTAPEDAATGTEVPVVVQGAPGTGVELWFSRAGGPFTRRREGVLGADGTYRTSWTASDDHVVFAAAAGRTSTRVRTTVPGATSFVTGPSTAPAVSVAVPDASDAGSTVPVEVSGTPGAPVAVWFRPRTEQVFTLRRTGRFDGTGRFRTSYAGLEDQELFATSGSAMSADAGVPISPVVGVPAWAFLGPLVLHGRARPGVEVVLEQQRRSGEPRTHRATANSRGAFAVTVPLDDESSFRATAGGRTGSAWSTAQVRPRIDGPARAGRGSVVPLSGTARPGAQVEVLFRRQGASGFVVGRRLVADASGRFRTSFGLSAAHRWYARADGMDSPWGLTQFR